MASWFRQASCQLGTRGWVWGAGRAARGLTGSSRPRLSAQRPQHEQPHGAAARPLPTPALPGGAVSRCLVGWARAPSGCSGAPGPGEDPRVAVRGRWHREVGLSFLPEPPVSVNSHKPPCGSPLTCSHPVPSPCHSKSWRLFLECPSSIPTAAAPRLSLTPGVMPAPSSRPHPFQGAPHQLQRLLWLPQPGSHLQGPCHLATPTWPALASTPGFPSCI